MENWKPRKPWSRGRLIKQQEKSKEKKRSSWPKSLLAKPSLVPGSVSLAQAGSRSNAVAGKLGTSCMYSHAVTALQAYAAVLLAQHIGSKPGTGPTCSCEKADITAT